MQSRFYELAREKNIELFMCSIDVRKVYDSEDRLLLGNVLARYGICKTISIIHQIHDGMGARVRLHRSGTFG